MVNKFLTECKHRLAAWLNTLLEANSDYRMSAMERVCVCVQR